METKTLEQKVAESFVNKFPNMFTEDKWFWVDEIAGMLNDYRGLFIATIQVTGSKTMSFPDDFKQQAGDAPLDAGKP